MNINLGWIFSLFKRKKKDGENEGVESFDKKLVTLDSVLNCCAQVGAFEGLGVDNDSLMKKICEDVVSMFATMESNVLNLKDALVKGFAQNSLQLNNKYADSFVDAFLESYIYDCE